ncbi:beta-propeller domain-containing protein [Candidatus Peregrinibacteria bacterium]|nr:beta-propeller domain-containing protein [Candidatus Peregrinibacteria bacterium]
MKKLISLSALLTVLFSLIFSNVSSVSAGGGSDAQLAYDLAGYIVSLKSSKGRSLWYVNPNKRIRYQVGGAAPAAKVIKEFGVLLKHSEIEKIQLGDFNALPQLKTPNRRSYNGLHDGEILVEKESPEKLWYVLPIDGKRYSLEDPKGPSEAFKKLTLHISAQDLKKIPQGNLATKKLKKFTSAKQFDRYIASLKKKKQKDMESGIGGAEEGGGGGEESVAAVSEESITNTQETGVDEGGIVKAYKNFFVILRRGRLFSVKIGDATANTLTPVSQVNAFPDGMTAANWYDELLISGNKIVVVGYSYIKQATEVGLFSISDEGIITHQNTYFLDSDDYYSSRNYASRLVGSTLIFYMPSYLFRYDYSYEGGVQKTTVETRLPKMRQWTSGDNTDAGKEILSKINIYQPAQSTLDPTLHTVVRCDLAAEFTCNATSVLGPYSRNFYVSPDAVYLWVNEWNSYAYAYRMPLDEDGNAEVLRADGSPIDQFSFKEQDGFLNVFVRSEGLGEAMWQPETTTGKMALLRVPLSTFKSSATLVSQDAYTALPSPTGYGVQNRFVGQYLLYGAGGPWWSDEDNQNRQEMLYAKKFASAEPAQTISLSHSIERLEIMGNGGIAIGSNGEDGLGFSSLNLGDTVAVSDTYFVPAASQGELRSHGYFFKQQPDGTGMVGLPIRHEGTAINSYLDDSAEVTFLNVDATQKFSSLGSLASTPEESREDGCKASCVDWYGNARPLFYMGRIFGLLGYELVEGQLAGNSITELQRMHLLK